MTVSDGICEYFPSISVSYFKSMRTFVVKLVLTK